MFRSCFFLTLLFISTLSCDRNNEENCCPPGYLWNSRSKSCTACRAGFFGPGCKFECKFPNYGQNCQMECKCNKTICSSVSGCLHVTTCRSGFLGSNCEFECTFPQYGEECKEKCNCSQEICSPQSGCPLVTGQKDYTNEKSTPNQKHQILDYTPFWTFLLGFGTLSFLIMLVKCIKKKTNGGQLPITKKEIKRQCKQEEKKSMESLNIEYDNPDTVTTTERPAHSYDELNENETELSERQIKGCENVNRFYIEVTEDHTFHYVNLEQID